MENKVNEFKIVQNGDMNASYGLNDCWIGIQTISPCA